MDTWEPTKLICPWNSPGKNTGMGCHALSPGFDLAVMYREAELLITPPGLKIEQPSSCSVTSICVRLFVTLWTVAHQAPLSIAFSRQEYWSGLPFPSPPMHRAYVSCRSCIAGKFLTTEPLRKPRTVIAPQLILNTTSWKSRATKIIPCPG